MSISGIIKLVSHLNIVVDKCLYRGKFERQKIIDSWTTEHPGLFHCGAVIQICPHASIYKVREDGTNSRPKELVKKISDRKRPPAIYTNLPVYNYKEDTPKNTTNE